MELTREVVASRAAAYADEEPLFAVESEQLEGLPGAFASAEYGFRDAEWVVRWHYRRYLGAFPDDRRRAAEAAFAENDRRAVRSAIADAVESSDTRERVEGLTALAGVDVPVASAFLQFIDPDRFVVVGEPEWSSLLAAGELDEPFPDRPTVEDYLSYVETCRSIAGRLGVDLTTLQRALWRLSGAP